MKNLVLETGTPDEIISLVGATNWDMIREMWEGKSAEEIYNDLVGFYANPSEAAATEASDRELANLIVSLLI